MKNQETFYTINKDLFKGGSFTVPNIIFDKHLKKLNMIEFKIILSLYALCQDRNPISLEELCKKNNLHEEVIKSSLNIFIKKGLATKFIIDEIEKYLPNFFDN